MYTYQHTIGSIHVIIKDNNPEPIAKTWNETEAQTIINALNLTEQLKETLALYHEEGEAQPGMTIELIEDLFPFAGTEEIEEAGPPQPCPRCESKTTSSFENDSLHCPVCGR